MRVRNGLLCLYLHTESIRVFLNLGSGYRVVLVFNTVAFPPSWDASVGNTRPPAKTVLAFKFGDQILWICIFKLWLENTILTTPLLSVLGI